ncbi:hypothetical protein C8F04DRAFT_731475 [Mycena alexandri]|uniref:MI domain-containing protein n=1 Tax=Mycena alexandri TaxID=1745969 RepID=A0AAD6SPV2_9AGAR|nr:hypothetical protein C8F04DRAFT_731475 [Mycena alexandri]
MRKKTSTTRLPQTLVERLGDEPGNDTVEPRKKWSNKSKPSRKELRKQERTGLKQRKAEFFSARPSKRGAEEEHTDSPQRKKVKLAAVVSKPPAPVPTPILKPARLTEPAVTPRAEPVKVAAKPAKSKKTALEKLAGRSDPTPKSLGPRSQRDMEEDAYIAYLESKLGYGKKNNNREDDGLDDLFELADSLALPTGGDESESGEDSAAEESDPEGDSEEQEGDEWHGIDADDTIDSEEGQSDDEATPAEDTSAAKPQPGTAYIPPHLRNRPRDEADSELIIKLTRQLKGLLNRMTEQNIASILDSIEEIYRNHRRNDVTSTLTTLIVDGISAHSSLLDSYVVLYAAFVSSLHKIIGIEFAAFFVQRVVEAYEQHYAELKDVDTAPVPVPEKTQTDASTSGKECSNLIVLVSELYNFQVISCVLVFDLIRGLLDTDLSEFSVELLLKIVRNSGQQLRTDDPSALKDIIQIVQNKISDTDEGLSSRTRFMVETLTNLKNNKIKRNTTLNQGGEAVERMKKFLSGLGKSRHVMAHEPLRVSLQDLHSSESKGKWWLVGAAWGGDPLVDRQDPQDETTATITPKQEDSGNSALLKLARKQGMNTDIRRSVFVVLMSSDDYVDACERLSQLNLTEVQQREIVRVLLHCCGNEKTYNPYYTLVAQHLCRTSHAHKITLQFCLWDFLRDLGEASVGGAEILKTLNNNENGGDEGFAMKNISATRVRNVARAYGWWVAKDCVGLGILKPVDFTSLKPQSQTFLKELFVQLFLSSQVATPLTAGVPTTRNRGPVEEVFIKASRLEALAMGLVYFLTEAFRDVEGMDEDVSKLAKWGCGVAKETLRAGVDVVPGL